MAINPVMLVITNLLLFISKISSTTDTITKFQSLQDGRTLVSEDGTFELGFFNPGISSNRYVGIWYKNIEVRTVVWVANRDKPTIDNSSMLIINQEGNLVLLSHNKSILWSTNSTTKALSPIVQLLDSGNLVLRDENDKSNEEVFLWQSFDYPSNSMLPGMKIGWDLKTGLNRRLIAWKNWDDPSPGDFTVGFELSRNPEPIFWKGSTVFHRSGPWNGICFSGTPGLRTNPLFDYKFINNSEEVYYTYNLRNKSLISILVLNQTLYVRQRIIWIPANKTWRVYQSVPQDSCDSYNLCGANGNCFVDASPVCQCLAGFVPKSSQSWNAMDWTQGCVRNEQWSCRVKNRDGFRKITGMKLPDTTHSWVNQSMTLEDCKAKCWENCSCMAYANLDVRGQGSGCSIWFGDLIDLRQFSEVGQDLYIRTTASDTSEVINGDAKDGHKKKVALVITITLLSGIGIVLLFAFSYVYMTKIKYKGKFLSQLVQYRAFDQSQFSSPGLINPPPAMLLM